MSEPRISSHYTSGLLFIAAKQAAQRAAGARGTLGEEGESITSIVLSVMTAEAGINVIGQWFALHHSRPPLRVPCGLPHGFERMELRMKWSLLPSLIRHRTFDTGTEPWQSFHALVELRNFVVHLKRGQAISHAASGVIEGKKLISSGYLGVDIANWACETIANLFEKLTELVEPPQEWINLLWCWTPAHSFPHGLSIPGDK